MKKSLPTYFKLTLAVLFTASLFTACTTEEYYDTLPGTEMRNETFTVKAKDWTWNPVYERFEYVFNYPAIDKYIYEQGVVHGAVYIVEDGFDNNGRPIQYETLKTLPFVQSYPEGNITYTETISFDVSPGFISFYIQASDLSNTTDYLTTYTFRVSLFWKN